MIKNEFKTEKTLQSIFPDLEINYWFSKQHDLYYLKIKNGDKLYSSQYHNDNIDIVVNDIKKIYSK